MQIELELIDQESRPAVFRVAFFDSDDRHLLQYPMACGLQFHDVNGKLVAEWGKRVLMSTPLDDFVLAPYARIAFDLYADINCNTTKGGFWSISVPNGEYAVRYVYHVDRDTDWYDFLAKRSRFAGMTPIWRGTQESNAVRLTVSDAESDIAK